MVNERTQYMTQASKQNKYITERDDCENKILIFEVKFETLFLEHN